MTSIVLASTFLALDVQAMPIPFESVSRIRVRLSEGVSSVQVQGYDLKIYPNHGAAAVVSSRQSHWQFRCQDNRVRAERVDSGENQIGTQTIELQEPVIIRSPAGFISFGGKPYREELQIHSVGSLCEVVNHVDIEKYLEGLVNGEFSSKWNDEAIGAQVIAARTYALYQIRQAQIEDLTYDVDASTSDQVYDGSIREDANSARMVSRTHGMVLTVSQRGSVIPLKAFYSSTCGGATELPERVWGSPSAGFQRSVRCPFCASSPRVSWDLDLKAGEIGEAIRRVVRNVGPPAEWPSNWKSVLGGSVDNLRIGGYDSSGRVLAIYVSFSRSGNSVQSGGDQANQAIASLNKDANRANRSVGATTQELALTGAKFREVIGFSKLRSTAFQVHLESASSLQWHFQGRGNGHGVGMCQWGAKVMGERGYKTAAILKFYYPDATLRRMW